MMLRNLKSEMLRRGVTAKQLSDLLGVRLTTIYDKTNGKYPFTFDEAVAIKKKFFDDENIEFLFQNEKQTSRYESEVLI